jgi:hypothetical protein
MVLGRGLCSRAARKQEKCGRGKVFWSLKGRKFLRNLKPPFTLRVAIWEESGIIVARKHYTSENIMKGFLIGTGVVGAYLALQIWILPSMGVQT